MSQYRKILLILPSKPGATPAYHRAQRLALATGAELHVCIFEHSAAITALAAVSRKVADVLKWDLIKQRELWLLRQADHLRASGVRTRTEVIWGSPVYEHVVDKVRKLQPDLVVKDVAAEPRAKRFLFTPLDRQLLRLCPASLLLVRGGARKLPRRVIAAVDTGNPLPGTDAVNDRIVRAALELALQCNASLHLVHAFGEIVPVSPGEVVSASTFSEVYDELRRIHRQRFEAFADRHGVPAECRHFLHGPRVHALLAFADRSHTDVLVLGTTYRTGMDRVLIGSTAEELLQDMRCDVLAVPPQGTTSPAARRRSGKRPAARAVGRRAVAAFGVG
jgi:universal stress protein E